MATSERAERKPLCAADLERLQAAVGRTAPLDIHRSLFGPGTLAWKVNRELAVLAGGGCALLLQVAHPLVAAGVAQYSNFKDDPLRRLYRTLDLMLTITFADAAEAIAAVRVIERRHARVRGTLAAAVGPFPRGTRYDANDPHLQLWVHATLVDTALQVYEMFIGALTDAERERYYAESTIVARLLGIPDALLPPTLRAFRAYMRDMCGGDVLAVSPAAKDIANSIMAPERPFGLKYVLPPLNLLSVGLLPAPLRMRYGFSWGAAHEIALRAAVATTSLTLPLLPDVLRCFPQARRAARRESRRGSSERQAAIEPDRRPAAGV